MQSRSLLLCCLVLAVAAVVAIKDGYVEILNRNAIPKPWMKGDPSPNNVKVNFVIALKQRNLDILEKTFWDISTPNSPQYRNFMTIDEIMNIVAPPQEDHDLVVSWLIRNGIRQIGSTGDGLEVSTTVGMANRLFSCRYFSFQHSVTKKVIHRVYGHASVPVDVHRLIDFVEGISTFPVMRYSLHPHRFNGTSPNDQEGVIPQTLVQIYQIPAMKQNGFPECSQSPIEFEGQCFDPQDLAQFSQLVNIPTMAVSSNHTVGPNNPSSPQLEASLDIEFMAIINNAATTWFWLEQGDGWLYQFVNHMFSTESIPEVQSISYGWSESDQCQIDPQECQQLGVNSQGYVERVNAEFQKIGMRGVSIFVSSGDSGANGRTDPMCTLPYLKPDYPGCSPFITSVGATQLNNPVYKLPTPPPICTGHGYSCASGGTEVAVSFDHAHFASGGGFSNYAPMPSYQTSFVKSYLASGVKLPPSTYFNASNRAYPDVAAIGSDVLIYQDTVYDVGGTSCSSPAFGAVAAILNHFAKQKSNKPLGFLNPFLYQMYTTDSTTFHDITVGDNICTESGCSSSCKGFLCTKGWDPVTGLGSPNVQNMINYINKHL